MNRRSFLLAVGATACGRATANPRRPANPPKPTPIPSEPAVNQDLSLRSSQLRASVIALYADVLIQIVDDELRRIDATTLKRLEAWNLSPRQFCFAQNGSLVVFAVPPGSTHTAVYRIDARGQLETFEGPILVASGASVVLPGRTADEIYVSDGDDIVRLHLHEREAEELPGMKHPSPNAGNRDQLFAGGDGRVVGPDRGGGLGVVEPDKPVAAYRTPGRSPMHLAPGTKDRVWYTYAPEVAWSASRLVLAQIATPMTELSKLDVAPGRIVHLAASGAAAAALVFEQAAARRTVVVVENSGAVRWRAEVPKSFNPDGALTAGFVAISDRRVVLAGPDHALLAWDATNGKPVG
jgi:hypothetical protein